MIVAVDFVMGGVVWRGTRRGSVMATERPCARTHVASWTRGFDAAGNYRCRVL